MKKIYRSITNHLRKPLNFYQRPWVLIGLNIVLSALIMIFYEPFGYHFDSWAEFTQLIGFTVIAFFSSVLFFLGFPQLDRMKTWIVHWTIGKNLVYSVVFLLATGLSISFYDFHLIQQLTPAEYGSKAFNITFLRDTVAVFTVGVVPLCIGLLLEKMYLMKQHIASFQNQQENSTPTQIPVAACESTQAVIELTGQTKENLIVNPEEIIYLESSGNYVDIHLLHSLPSHKTIRTTLKDIELQLAGQEGFIRCHRAYIVNTRFIQKMERNAQGYYLLLTEGKMELPVSRTYIKELRNIFPS